MNQECYFCTVRTVEGSKKGSLRLSTHSRQCQGFCLQHFSSEGKKGEKTCSSSNERGNKATCENWLRPHSLRCHSKPHMACANTYQPVLPVLPQRNYRSHFHTNHASLAWTLKPKALSLRDWQPECRNWRLILSRVEGSLKHVRPPQEWGTTTRISSFKSLLQLNSCPSRGKVHKNDLSPPPRHC